MSRVDVPSWQSRVASLVIRAFVKRRIPGDALPIELVRRHLGRGELVRRLAPRSVRIEPVEDGAVRGEWVSPMGRVPDLVVLYLHGGGYISCSPVTHRPITVALAQYAQARVFVARYRLAPEHPFPAAVDDAVAAYRWLLAHGTPPARIAIAGDSAGGGLALSTLVALRDAGDPLPGAAVCFSPWTDLAGTGPSLDLNERTCAFFYGHTIRIAPVLYLGQADRRHPLASPLYADLRGLPPLLIHASTSETLRDDSTRLAERARAAGVDVELRLWAGQPHVWQVLHPLVPEARESLVQAARFLRQRVVEQVAAARQPTLAAGPV